MGHPALVQPKDTEPNAQMVVHFALPRPEGGTPVVEAEFVEEDGAVKVCDECHVEKPADQFVAASSRCNDCYAARRARVLAQFGDDVD